MPDMNVKKVKTLCARVAKIEHLLYDAKSNIKGKDIAYSIIQEDAIFIDYRQPGKEYDKPMLELILLEAKSDLIAYRSSNELRAFRDPLLNDVLKLIILPMLCAIVISVAASFVKSNREINSYKDIASFQADYSRTTKLIEDLLKIQTDVYSLRHDVIKAEQEDEKIEVVYKVLRDRVQRLERMLYSKTQYLPYPDQSVAKQLKTKGMLHLKRLFLCLGAKQRGGKPGEWKNASKQMNDYLKKVTSEIDVEGLQIKPAGEEYFGQNLDPGIFEDLTGETNKLLFDVLGSQIYKSKLESKN